MVGIVSSVQDIVRSEIQLAKVEISEIVERTRNAGVMLATGGILGLFGLGFLLLTAMFALEIVLPNWAAALIMGVLLMLGAATYERCKSTPKDNRNGEGDLRMDERTAQIVKDIAEERQRLGDNIAEFDRKVKNAVDWRSYFARNPWGMLGLAFGGGWLLSGLLR
jgi:membrane protein implicated in regulation of membrane protease activity